MTTQQDAQLAADALAADPRVAQAKQLLLEAVADHQGRINGLRPASQTLRDSYQKQLERFAEQRGGKLWYPYLGSGLGKGCLVELADGSVKYDMIGGIGVHYFGHNHPQVMSGSIDAAIGNTIQQGHLMQNRESQELCERLVELSGLDHCFLSTTGAMANENAFKIAFQKKHPADRILAFTGNFAGRTMAISQVTDKPKYRAGLPASLRVDYIPFYDASRPEESTQETLKALHAHISRYPGQHAFILAELVQGEGGFYPGSEDYFKRIFGLCREHGIAVIADEVQTFGRTPQLFAFRHFKLEDYVDLVTIGKLSQTCATLYRADFKPKPGLLSQTFTSTGVAIRSSLTILDELTNGTYYGEGGRVKAVHQRFTQRFEEIRSRHPSLIQGPYGIGAMVAFQPYDGDSQRVLDFSQALFQAGIISFTTGANPMRIRFLVPAMVIGDEDIDAVCRILEETLVKEAP